MLIRRITKIDNKEVKFLFIGTSKQYEKHLKEKEEQNDKR